MRTRTWISASIVATSLAAGCGTDLDFGSAAVAPPAAGNAPGAAAPDAGATSPTGPGLPGDAGSGPQLTPCPSGRLCWADPLPTGDHFSGIWASADDDVWMVTVSGTVIHWNGSALDAKYQAAAATTARVWGFARNDVWFVLNGASNTPQQIHWDGATFTDRTGINEFCSRPPAAIAGATLDGAPEAVILALDGSVSLYSPTHGEAHFVAQVPLDGHAPIDVVAWSDAPDHLIVWALRDDGHLFKMAASGLGEAWQEEPFDPPPSGTIAGTGAGLWGTSASDVWAFYEVQESDGYVTTVFRHFDGTSWTTKQSEKMSRYTHDFGAGEKISGRRMWGSSGADIWASGETVGMWHWDGQSWAVGPSTENFSYDVTDSAYSLLFGAGTTLWAVGDYGRIHRRDGNGWSKLAGGNQYDAIVSISAPQDDDVWALRAESGTSLRQGSMSVLHFDGSAWKALLPLAADPWPRLMYDSGSSMIAFAANDAWLSANVGESPDVPYDPNRKLLHWNGAWNVVGEVPNVVELWGSGPNDVWAASVAGGYPPSTTGELRRWNGAAWTKLPIDEAVAGISGTGPDDVWLLTRTPSLFHWNGASFAAVAMPASPCGGRVLATGSGEAWMFDQARGCTQHWDGSTWQTLTAPTVVLAAWASSPSDVWFVGSTASNDRAALLHWDGRSFGQDVAQPVGPALAAASGAGPNDMWVAGAGGAILRTSFVAKPVTH